MTLDDLKRAAKRLRKNEFGLGPRADASGKTGPGMTHAEALDLVSKLHGYRDFHEAQQRLGSRPLLQELLGEPGGLLCSQAISVNAAELVLSLNGTLSLEGRSGTGKGIVVMELVSHALLKDRPVRILDWGGSYRRYAQLMGGAYHQGPLTEHAIKDWGSDKPFVVLDGEGCLPGDFDLARLPALPARTFLTVDEFWRFASSYQPVEVSGMTVLLVVQREEDLAGLKKPVTRRIRVEQAIYPRVVWSLALTQGTVRIQMHLGPKRFAAYSTNPRVTEQLGRELTPQQLQEFASVELSRLLG